MKSTNTDPAALRIARAAFPDWRGRKAKFDRNGTCGMYGTYWSEGSINEYVAVNLATGMIAETPLSMKSPRELGGTGGDSRVVVPAGFAIVCRAIFCERDCGCTVYLAAAPALASVEALALP